VNVSEEKPVNTLVTQVKAFDANVSSHYNTFKYSIEQILRHISLEQLNYTVSKQYNLTVKAKDTFGKIGETTVVIKVWETPGLHFEHDLHNAMIPENEVGRFQSIHPAPIKAFDGDQEIIYSISKVSPEEFWGNFAIEKETEVINVKKELKREKASLINMAIMASLKNDSMKTAVAT
ncbi:hypothetical protein AALO_G00098420, partial [Alosa alosa]